MLKVSQLGAMVLPPEPPFYLLPETIDDIVQYIVNRVLVALGVEDTLPDAEQYHPRGT
jgi:4-hydroxy-3-polyprenylbenzoate decarboxylase